MNLVSKTKMENSAVIFENSFHHRLRQKMSYENFSEALRSFLRELTRQLENSGCRLIGHIKGSCHSSDGGGLFFNLTSFSDEADTDNQLPSEISEFDFHINIIIFGIISTDIKAIYSQQTEKFLQGVDNEK